MQFEKAYDFLIKKLETETPKYISYHSQSHTVEVIQLATQLAEQERVHGKDLVLLKTAALFHDVGYLETYNGHEEFSCRMAESWLPQFGYTTDDIERINRMIMATKKPPSPHDDHLAKILCDANLYYLGTNSYRSKSNSLFKEMHEAGVVKDREQWRNSELKFLRDHGFFTNTAKASLTAQLRANEAFLKEHELGYKPQKRKGKNLEWLREGILMVAGVLLASFALKGFLVPNRFFDGGVTGISLLIHEIYHLNLGVVIVAANLPLIITSVYAVNLRFALKTLVSVIMLGLCLYLIHFPTMTGDHLLVPIFGGFFLGTGVGLTMRAGCAIDGIEILALYTFKKTSFTITEIIFAINIVIFSVAAYFFTFETALYSALTYFTATKTIDFVVEGLEAYIGVTIISGKSEIIKDRLVNELGRGITIYKGERGYLPGSFAKHEEVDIIFTVVTRLELRKLNNLVYDIDEKAFMFANMIRDAAGGIIKRRHVH